LIKAGIPLIDSLTLIREQTASKSKVKIFDDVINDVNNGQYLAGSMEKYKHLFGEFTINLIRVGESSGILSQNLAYLADELQKKDALRKKVVGALVYPLVITFATFGITGACHASAFYSDADGDECISYHLRRVAVAWHHTIIDLLWSGASEYRARPLLLRPHGPAATAFWRNDQEL
jgi:hypothetical protein